MRSLEIMGPSGKMLPSGELPLAGRAPDAVTQMPFLIPENKFPLLAAEASPGGSKPDVFKPINGQELWLDAFGPGKKIGEILTAEDLINWNKAVEANVLSRLEPGDTVKLVFEGIPNFQTALAIERALKQIPESAEVRLRDFDEKELSFNVKSESAERAAEKREERAQEQGRSLGGNVVLVDAASNNQAVENEPIKVDVLPLQTSTTADELVDEEPARADDLLKSRMDVNADPPAPSTPGRTHEAASYRDKEKVDRKDPLVPDLQVEEEFLQTEENILKKRGVLEGWVNSVVRIEESGGSERTSAIQESYADYYYFAGQERRDLSGLMIRLGEDLAQLRYAPAEVQELLGRIGLEELQNEQVTQALHQRVFIMTSPHDFTSYHNSWGRFGDTARLARIWEDDDQYANFVAQREVAVSEDPISSEELRRVNSQRRLGVLLRNYDDYPSRVREFVQPEIVRELLRGVAPDQVERYLQGSLDSEARGEILNLYDNTIRRLEGQGQVSGEKDKPYTIAETLENGRVSADPKKVIGFADAIIRMTEGWEQLPTEEVNKLGQPIVEQIGEAFEAGDDEAVKRAANLATFTRIDRNPNLREDLREFLEIARDYQPEQVEPKIREEWPSDVTENILYVVEEGGVHPEAPEAFFEAVAQATGHFSSLPAELIKPIGIEITSAIERGLDGGDMERVQRLASFAAFTAIDQNPNLEQSTKELIDIAGNV